MFRSLLLGSSATVPSESENTTRKNAATAAASRLPSPKRNTAQFSLVEHDAGSLLSSEAANPSAENEIIDDDELAGNLLMQFPTYGTQSQALSNNSSTQWQEKTADWLLGGTSSIPTPKQQLQRQQQQQQQMNGSSNSNSNSSNKLSTVDEQNGNDIAEESGYKSNHGYDAASRQQKLVNSREWSVDEQLLWKSHKFSCSSNRRNSSNVIFSGKNSENKVTNRDGDALPLTEREDPSRDFLAAYYYHVGVMPKALDRLEETRKIYVNNNGTTRFANTSYKDDGVNDCMTAQKLQQLQCLIKQHSSPYHMNNDIRKDISFFGGIASLPNILEEKEGEDGDYGVHYNPNHPNMPSKSLITDKDGSSSGVTSIVEVAWMPDRLCKTCYSCDTPFTVFRRRHHCRICGQVFCNTCSGYFVPASSTTSSSQKLSSTMPSSPQRYTNYEIGGPTSTASARPSASPQSSSLTSFGANGGKDNNGNGNITNSKITLRTCKMCFDQVTARQEKQKKLDAADEDRKRQQTKGQQGNSSSGNEIAANVTPQKRHGSVKEAAQSPHTGGFSSRLQDLKINNMDGEESSVLRQWSKIMGAEGISYHTSRGLLGEEKDPRTQAVDNASPLILSKRQTSNSSSTSSLVNLDRSRVMEEGNRHLGSMAASHLEQMAASLLESDAPILWKKLCDEHVSAGKDGTRNKEDVKKFRSKWVNKLMSLATRCCATVDTNIKRGDMLDVRPYVKIKVIPGGSCDECAYISGIVFRKTGTNKQMPREIINPKIMVSSEFFAISAP